MLRVLVLLFTLLAGQAGAAPLVLDAGTSERIDLASHVEVLRDASGALDATTVRRRVDAFAPLPPGQAPNFGYTDDAIWLRLVLQSRLDLPSDWRLELDYGSLDHAELHDADGTVQRAGDRIPFAERSIPHRNPVFAVQLAPGETRELLLGIRSEGSVTSNPSLWRADAFAAHSEAGYAGNATYFGILLALAGYNLLLFLALRERVFVFYVVSVIGMGVGIACVYGYRLPPYGIRARMSEDGGRTWGSEIILRSDGGSWDVGYPRVIEVENGTLLTVYYINLRDDPVQVNGGVRHVARRPRCQAIPDVPDRAARTGAAADPPRSGHARFAGGLEVRPIRPFEEQRRLGGLPAARRTRAG